jgi:LacI family transcriptional regulator
LWPFLTVIPQPAETFGIIAAQLLLERIAGRGSEQRRVVILPSDLIVRESCGARLRSDPGGDPSRLSSLSLV